MNKPLATLTVNVTANTSDFEASMKRATDAARAFRKALEALPWYIRWIMAVQRLWERLVRCIWCDAADGGVVPPGRPYVVGENSGCGCFHVGDGVTGDKDGFMGQLRRKQETGLPVRSYWRNGQGRE